MADASEQGMRPLRPDEPGSFYPNVLNLAKITRPTPSQVIERPRLYGVLDKAAECPVFWVSGPGGSGKTTLVAAYVQVRGLNCLWYQVDPDDDDPASLFHFLRLAAQKKGIAEELLPPAFAPDYLPGIRMFARRFFRELFGGAQAPFALTFDNVHDVAESSILFEILREGLNQIPPGSRVLLMSRAGPPPAFSGLRATRQMLELSWNELRFTEEESE